jgi:hypothetical protein
MAKKYETKSFHVKKQKQSWAQYWSSVIPATGRLRCRRWWLQASPGKKICKTSYQSMEKAEQGGMHCHSRYGRKHKTGGSHFRPVRGKQEPISKITRIKRACNIVQVVEPLT